MKLELTQQIFEIYSNIKFHENAVSGKQAVLCGRAGGQKEKQTRGQTLQN
jgi:hypothetical protein